MGDAQCAGLQFAVSAADDAAGKWATSRATKIRYEIYAAGGHVARHARQLTIKVSEENFKVMKRALRSIDRYSLLA